MQKNIDYTCWYDNDPKKSLAQKIAAAAEWHRRKFNRQPVVCYANPLNLAGAPDRVQGLAVVPQKNVLLHHYMVGVA
jgi:hypothetical protein